MENGKYLQFNNKNNQNRNSGQRVRSITPCLQRKDEMVVEMPYKKSSFHIQTNAFHQQLQPSSVKQNNNQIQSKMNNFTTQSHFDQQYTQQLILQAQGVLPKKTEPIASPIQTENMFMIYQDIFNNENNRFRSLSPNFRWSKRNGNIRQRNENSYIINQVQNKKQLANQNKDLFILSNYWEKKQQESQQTNYIDKSQSSFSPLPTLPLSSSPINGNDGDFHQNSKFIQEKQNNMILNTNPIINLQESPERSIWLPSPKMNSKIPYKHEQSIQNIEDSPLRGGETAHFNNYLQNTILEYIQQQKGQQEQKNKTQTMKTTQRNSIFDNSFIVEKQSIFPSKNVNSKQRSATPSAVPHYRINENNINNEMQRMKGRRQLKLNKSNINFFAEKSTNQSFQSKRVHTEMDNTDDDNFLFIKYNDENIFQQNQNEVPRRNFSKSSIRVVKDTLTQIVQPDNGEDQHPNQQSFTNLNQFSITNVKNYQKNPSVVQYTPKSTMQKYSKVQRFIPIQNRIIRYPAFINIMHNTTRDQSFQILKKNKLIDNEIIKQCI